MADIELVIKIPEEVYESAKNGTLNEIQSMYICGSVVNGTPLPKGHGRLIDADRLINKYAYDLDNNFIVDLKDIKDAPTIIEADEESEVEE